LGDWVEPVLFQTHVVYIWLDFANVRNGFVDCGVRFDKKIFSLENFHAMKELSLFYFRGGLMF
jgi:hypothetical protein